jgi:hypothetical protein
MSLFSKLVIFYAVFAIGLMSFGIPTPFNAFISGSGDLTDFVGNSSTGFIAGIAAATVAGIAVSILGGFAAVSFVIFAAFAAFFLTFLTFPASLTGAAGLPTEFANLLQGFVVLLNIVFTIALVSWLKGNE